MSGHTATPGEPGAMREALQTAIGHIDHMAAFITKANCDYHCGVYSFESLGEDMPGIRAALSQTYSKVTDEMVNAAIEAAWPGPEIVYADGHDSAEAMMRAALEAALSIAPMQPADSHADLVKALEKIEKWFGEFPETGRFWHDGVRQQPMSYGAAFGSNGERDFMREIARAALATLTARKVG